jgi:uncharacterized surface protein with fasciclin (FAS1) repeats
MTRWGIAATTVAVAALMFVGCAEKEVKAERPGPEEVVELEEAIAPEAPADVFTTLVRVGRCGTLVAALEKTGLSETLMGPGPFTLFAPTDDAFAALPEGRLDYLMEHPDELKALLLRHVAPAKIPFSELTWSNTIRTINGKKLVVVAEDGIERIDGAVVIQRDVMATNGVIHVIDAVLAGPGAP